MDPFAQYPTSPLPSQKCRTSLFRLFIAFFIILVGFIFIQLPEDILLKSLEKPEGVLKLTEGVLLKSEFKPEELLNLSKYALPFFSFFHCHISNLAPPRKGIEMNLFTSSQTFSNHFQSSTAFGNGGFLILFLGRLIGHSFASGDIPPFMYVPKKGRFFIDLSRTGHTGFYHALFLICLERSSLFPHLKNSSLLPGLLLFSTTLLGKRVENRASLAFGLPTKTILNGLNEFYSGKKISHPTLTPEALKGWLLIRFLFLNGFLKDFLNFHFSSGGKKIPLDSLVSHLKISPELSNSPDFFKSQWEKMVQESSSHLVLNETTLFNETKFTEFEESVKKKIRFNPKTFQIENP